MEIEETGSIMEESSDVISRLQVTEEITNLFLPNKQESHSELHYPVLDSKICTPRKELAYQSEHNLNEKPQHKQMEFKHAYMVTNLIEITEQSGTTFQLFSRGNPKLILQNSQCNYIYIYIRLLERRASRGYGCKRRTEFEGNS